MKILLVQNSRIPIQTYDDAERILWWLGKSLHQLGHEVSYLVKKGSTCPFAKIFIINEKKPLQEQIPDGFDVVHFHCQPASAPSVPYLVTQHRNAVDDSPLDPNTVFLSRNQARRHGGKVYVHPGIDFADYGRPDWEARRMFFHFLGNAAWSGKNVRGAIDVAGQAGARLHVIGGSRVNFRKGLRITLSPHVRFHGVLSNDGRNMLLNQSKGLIFPALWAEPFGLSVVESLYFGCPVFGTPYGALPELLGKRETPSRVHVGQDSAKAEAWNGQVEAFYSELGCLSVKRTEVVEAVKNAEAYDRKHCHEYACEHFSAEKMALKYVELYEKVARGESLHPQPLIPTAMASDQFMPFGN